MDLSRSEYPAMLSSLQPTPAVTVLRERMRRVQQLNTEIADWFQERKKLEEAYALGLLKISKRGLPGDHSGLGVFHPSWTRINNSLAKLATSHLELAQKLEAEVERPLRQFAQSNKEWTSLKTYEGNLAGIAKSVDTAEEKSERLRKKGSRAQTSRVVEAAAALEKASGDWESQAPFVFEKLQAVDESRCMHVRDSLTRYHTLELDLGQSAMQIAQESLSTLLDLNTNDEIKTFAESVTNGRPKNEKYGSRAPSTAAAGMPSSTPSIVTDDSVSVQSAGSGTGSGGGSGGALSHGLGLRRLGTVLRGRHRNNNNTPYPQFSSPIRSSEKLSSREGQHPITPASPRMTEFPSSSSRNLAVPAPPSSSAAENARPSTPKANGTGIPPPNGPTPPASISPSGMTPPPTADALQPPLTPSVSVTEEPRRDSEGYTIPPPVADIGGVIFEESIEPTQPQFKLEIKNDVILEEEEEADAAMSKVASHLRLQNTVTRKTRGRRDVRNTMFFPSTPGSVDPLELMHNSSPPLTPLKVPRMSPAGASSEASDTQSIRSSHSASSLGGTVRHPELHELGLSASLVETVSAHFEAGAPTKVTMIGEVALAYNPRDIDPIPPFSTDIVRMDNFAVLDKVAPNPAFITPVPEKSGEYSIHLANLHKTAVAFRYQVHVDEASWSALVPIILTPVWRIEPHQASVILNYKPNPNYRRLSGATGPITLRNVVFLVGIEGAVPSNCQSRPVGELFKEKGRLVWKIGDITLDPESGSGGGKMLARFMTEAAAAAGVTVRHAPTEMKWEVTGEEAATIGSGLALSSWVPEESAQEAKEAQAEVEVDPFADEEAASPKEAEFSKEKGPAGDTDGAGGSWRQVPGVRKVASGKYWAS